MHPSASKEYLMKIGQMTERDGTKKEFMYCPRCYYTVFLTPEIKREMAKMQVEEKVDRLFKAALQKKTQKKGVK